MTFISTLKSRLTEIQQKVSDEIDHLVPTVSEEEKANRLEVCHSCDYLFRPTHQCRKCGCFVHAKAVLANSDCPIGKWKPITITNDANVGIRQR